MENRTSMDKKAIPGPDIVDDVRTGVVDDIDLKKSEVNLNNVDLAANFLVNTQGYRPLTPEAEKALKRKIDWIMIPMQLDAVYKVALGTAALYGLKEDNHLVGQQYSWLGSILSLGAMVRMFPSTWLIQRFPATKYLCACSLGWSAMSLFLPACHNWAGLMVVRFFMGSLEAIIVPVISLILAGFYTKEEQPPRNALVFAAASSVINGFLSWAIGHVPKSAPLAIWQYLFLLTGSVSFAYSIIAIIIIPNAPMDAKFLSPEQKYHAVQRLAANKTGIVNHTFKMDQAKEAFLDLKTWLLFLFNIAINIPNGGLTTFGGLIIAGFGFSGVNASLLSMPTGVMSTLAAFIFSWIAAKWTNKRCLVTVIACIIPINLDGVVLDEGVIKAFLDQTDFQQEGFRYTT